MNQSCLSDFGDILQHVPGRVHALGYVNRKVSAWEHIVSLLISSTVGLLAKTLLQKEKREYVALTESSLLLLSFAGDKLVSTTEMSLQRIEAGQASIDESLVRLSFTYAGTGREIELLRYQIVNLDGEAVTDAAVMQQIGAMTARIGHCLLARRLAA
jgi:hypothetical protein